MRLGFWRAAMGACNIAGWFGFIEIRWGGAQVMIGGESVDPFFIEVGSVFLAAFGGFAAIGLSWNWIEKWSWVERLLTTERAKVRVKQKSLQELGPQIRAVRDNLIAAKSRFEFGGRTINRYKINAEIEDINIRLKTIGLIVPESVNAESIFEVIDQWIDYLPLLLPLAEMGDYSRATSISFTSNNVELNL